MLADDEICRAGQNIKVLALNGIGSLLNALADTVAEELVVEITNMVAVVKKHLRQAPPLASADELLDVADWVLLLRLVG